jgi:hypothetical protein
MYKRQYANRILNSLPTKTLINIKVAIRSGHNVDALMKDFPILKTYQARFLYFYYKEMDFSTRAAKLGHKDEPYFEGDFPIIPKYRLEDLTGEEKMIAKNGPKAKLIVWEK